MVSWNLLASSLHCARKPDRTPKKITFFPAFPNLSVLFWFVFSHWHYSILFYLVHVISILITAFVRFHLINISKKYNPGPIRSSVDG